MELPEKFDSVEALSEAYKNLEKEFTKRCNMVSNLQKQVDELNYALSQNKPCQEVQVPREISDEEKEAVIQEFLKGITQNKSSAILHSAGEAVKAPPKKPKTLKEANLMAKYFLLGD